MTNTARPTIADFMTTEPCTVDAGLTLADAEDRMQANNIRHLLVSEGERVIGLVSNRDTSFAAGWTGADARKLTVSDAMSTKVFTCRPDDPLEDVAWEMERNRFGCAVVMDNDAAVGIFTTTDALRALRQLVHGGPVDPAVTPTHRPPAGATRNVVEHHTRLGAMLSAHRASPHTHDGLIR